MKRLGIHLSTRTMAATLLVVAMGVAVFFLIEQMDYIFGAAASKEAASMRAGKIAVEILLMLLVSLVALLVLRRTFAPLDQLASVADRIAAGEKGVLLPQTHGGKIGSLVRALDTMMDKLAQREKLLQESEARSRIIMETIDEVFWMADVQIEKMHYISPSYERVWGRTVQSLYENPHSFTEAIHPEDRQRVLSGISAMYKEKPFEHEYRIVRPDGAIRWIWDRGFPIRDSTGKVASYAGIAQDITERKQLDEMRAQMENTSRINIADETTASMAHELSQPLTACNNYLNVCLRRMEGLEWDREKLKETLQLASEQAKRAGDIMRHFRGTVKRPGPENVLVDINLLVMDVTNFMGGYTKRHDISVRMALSTLPRITVHREEIQQVLLNLCENAIEAMHSSAQRELRVTTRIIESGHILVAVGDSGEGITPDRMKTLFEPFHSSRPDSLGLGLSICRTFVEKHGGRIWADPQRETGAEFYFTLPFEVGHEQKHE